MAMAKSEREARLRKTAYRLDFLKENACARRTPEAWNRYHEAILIAEMLGFKVSLYNNKHVVAPC